MLLISDEVICGFGRTGNLWGCETFDYTPDLITFAKAVTNGYQPLGGVGVSDAIAEVITTSGGSSPTASPTQAIPSLARQVSPPYRFTKRAAS